MARHSPKQPARLRRPQLDLFGPVPTAWAASTPGWATLPEETRRTLTGLMTHPLVADGRDEQVTLRQEAADDV